MTPVFDSNIIIDFLRGKVEAAIEFKLYQHRYISIITWIEVMAGANSTNHTDLVRTFLADNFTIIELDSAIAELTVDIRRVHRLKLPDAIIWATAQKHNALLVTRDSNFPANHPSIRIPYQLTNIRS